MSKFNQFLFLIAAMVCFCASFFYTPPNSFLLLGFGWVFHGISVILEKLNG